MDALAIKMEVFLKPKSLHIRMDREGYGQLATHLKNVARLCPKGEAVAMAAAEAMLAEHSNRPA